MAQHHKGWVLRFQWIPSHCDILGNDTVDELANEGRQLRDATYPIELDDIKIWVKKNMYLKWQQCWNIAKQASDFGGIKPIIGNWSWCRSRDRAIDVAMTRLRMGKVGLNKYLYRIRVSPSDICTLCDSGNVEDVEHFLITCQKYVIPRLRLFTCIQNMGIYPVNIKTLLGGSVHTIEHKISKIF